MLTQPEATPRAGQEWTGNWEWNLPNPAFGTCWISAACHPACTTAVSSATAQRIRTGRCEKGVAAWKFWMRWMRKEIEIRAPWPTNNEAFWEKRDRFTSGGRSITSWVTSWYPCTCVCCLGPMYVALGQWLGIGLNTVMRRNVCCFHGPFGDFTSPWTSITFKSYIIYVTVICCTNN